MAAIDHIGKYQVLGTLGSGAHSTILHVRRQADSREYALKTVPIQDRDDLKFLEQARHEFRVAQMLSHPNLIKIYCLETQKDWFFRTKGVQLLIEYVNGKTLDTVPLLSMEKLVPILARISVGMMHMHRRGVFHADLKPNNILYGKRGEVKIIDYGLAWIKGEKKDRVQGTPEYMAPETARGKIINERTEIFNFGATMYRLMTLKPPPALAASPESLRMDEKTWKAMLQPIRDINHSVPESLEKLVDRCMSFQADARPQSMAEVYEALKQIGEEVGEMIEGGTDLGAETASQTR